VIRFTGYGVIADKPHVSHLPKFFRAPIGKTVPDRKMTDTFLEWSQRPLPPCKVWGDRLCASVGAKIWCLSVFCFISVCHSLPAHCCLRGTYFEQVPFMDQFLRHFHSLFLVIALSEALQSSHFHH